MENNYVFSDKIRSFTSDTEFFGVDLSTLARVNSEYTEREISDAISAQDRETLIRMSNYFYDRHGEYRQLIWRLSNINTYRYIITPLRNYAKKSKSNIGKDYQAVMEYAIKTGLDSLCNVIDFYVLKDGAFFGYEKIVGDNVVLQQLPASYCRSRFKDHEGKFAVEFNFKFFDDHYRNQNDRFEVFSQLPDEFEELYNVYKSAGGRGAEWQLLSIDNTRCHMLDDKAIPFFADIFDDLIKHSEYKAIDMLKSKLNLYKLIVQQIPLNKNHEPITSEDEFMALHEAAKGMIGGEGVDVLTTIADVFSIDLNDKSEKASSFIENGLKNIKSASGASEYIFDGGDRPQETALKFHAAALQAILMPLSRQYEIWYNSKFRKICSNKNQIVIKFLDITLWNEEDKVDSFKEQALASGSKLAFYASMGINQFMLDGIIELENNYFNFGDRLMPLATSYTQSAKVEDKTKPKDDEDKGDNDEE